MQMIHNILSINQSIIDQVPNGLVVIGILWIVHAINYTSGYRLLILGVIPRRVFGLLGIACAPFLHANFDHIFFNSVPLFILSTFLMTSTFQQAVYVTLSIILLSGTLTWLLARKAIHVGASGVIMGYMGYLLSECYYGRSPSAWIIGIITLYYLGSLLFSLIPDDTQVSFEGHIFGFASGIYVSLYPIPFFYSMALNITPDVSYVFQTIRSIF